MILSNSNDFKFQIKCMNGNETHLSLKEYGNTKS